MEVPLYLFRCGSKIFKQVCRPSVRYYSEKIVPLNESTVIGRIVLFMNNEYINKSTGKINDDLKISNKSPQINKVIDKIKLNQINHISNLKFEQIEELLSNLKYEDYTTNVQHFKRLMNLIDTECCSRLEYLDSNSILRILNVFTQSVPNRIREYNFYEEALNHLMLNIDYLLREELIQTIFYIGLQKKTKLAQNMLRKCIRKFSKSDIEALSTEELCIVCDSSFKTSTKIANRQILEKVKRTLNDKLHILKDTGLFIILVKTVRHNRYQDADLLKTISCTILFNQTYKYYTFPVLCHILAMYADYNFYDSDLLDLFTDIGLKQLKESTVPPYAETITTRHIRCKDITRFLWSLSKLGYNGIKNDTFENVIIPNIKERIKAGYYKKDIEELVNSILYMWMLNYQPLDIIPGSLTNENVTYIRDIQSKTKIRLNLLLMCIFFENKKLFKDLNVKVQKFFPTNIEYQLEQRPNLVKLLTTLRQLTDEMIIDKFEVTCEVPHLNICGITGYTNKLYKTVYIEVLDDYVCLKNQYNMPNGPMQLKLRILREMDDALLIIPNDIVEELSGNDLKEYLKSELEFLC